MKNVVMLLLSIIFVMTACSEKQSGSTASSSTNEAIDCILTRTSVRRYIPGKAIGADTVEIMLRAAMAAPTAVNKQPWAFVVVNERAVLDSLMAACPYAHMLEQAPMAVVVCGDLSKALDGEARDMWIEDASAATENLLLAAHALGLGAVWTGVYPVQERMAGVRKALSMPQSIVPLAVVPVGYPAGESTPKDKWNPDNIHYNAW
jgi:nitroreductase